MLFVLIQSGFAQDAWFTDGYHGGVYGHYPHWQAKFMVDKLNQYADWAINLEIEPETWDSVFISDKKNFIRFQKYYANEGHKGRIEFVNPSYAQPYCYNISGESIIRQFQYGMAKTVKYFPEATFTTYACEEPCFTSCLPQILKGLGYEYAVLRNPNTCWGGYTSSFGKDLVNWIGPDGTEILAVPRYACEELSNESTWQTDSWTNSNQFIETCFENGIQYPVGMCFQDAGWDGGPWGNKYQPTHYTTWTEYFKMVEHKVKPTDWHFTVEDVKPGLVWGAQVLQKIAQQVRTAENHIVMAEKLAVLDYVYGKKPWLQADFDEAWRTLMLAQHHDCWIVPYNGKPNDTWAHKVTRWTATTNRVSEKVKTELFKQDKVKTDSNSEKLLVRVYNTLAHHQNKMVSLLLNEDLQQSHLEVYTMKGDKLPSQIYTDQEGDRCIAFMAVVPSMGYETFEIRKVNSGNHQIEKCKEYSGTLKIKTNYYEIEFDADKGGCITSLVDKSNNDRQLLLPGRYLNNLKGFFYNENQFHNGFESKAKVTVVEDGAVFVKVKVENEIAGNKYQQFITISKYNPIIDFDLHIDWNGQPGIGAYDHSQNYRAEDRRKAFYNDACKLHVEFPLAKVGKRLFKNAPFDVFESELNNTLYSSWDSIKHNVILNWVDLTDSKSEYGVSLFTDHTTSYLHSDDLSLGLTVNYIGKGLWGRDYGVDGSTRMHYALMAHHDDWEEAGIEHLSNEWNEPMIASIIDNKEDVISESLFEVDDQNLHVSSMIIDGEDLIIRFFSTSSNNDEKVIKWNCVADEIELTDLNNKKQKQLKPEYEKSQMITYLKLPQFGIQTMRLTNVRTNKNDN